MTIARLSVSQMKDPLSPRSSAEICDRLKFSNCLKTTAFLWMFCSLFCINVWKMPFSAVPHCWCSPVNQGRLQIIHLLSLMFDLFDCDLTWVMSLMFTSICYVFYFCIVQVYVWFSSWFLTLLNWHVSDYKSILHHCFCFFLNIKVPETQNVE